MIRFAQGFARLLDPTLSSKGWGMRRRSFKSDLNAPELLRCDNLLLNMPVIKKIAKKRNGIEPY